MCVSSMAVSKCGCVCFLRARLGDSGVLSLLRVPAVWSDGCSASSSSTFLTRVSSAVNLCMTCTGSSDSIVVRAVFLVSSSVTYAVWSAFPSVARVYLCVGISDARVVFCGLVCVRAFPPL